MRASSTNNVCPWTVIFTLNFSILTTLVFKIDFVKVAVISLKIDGCLKEIRFVANESLKMH